MVSRIKSSTCKIALLIHYDGAAYHGWQIQPHKRTVQGELEKALYILTGEHTRVIASGRTDTGVHALGQVAHFILHSDISLQRICAGLNGIMQKDISVLNAYHVPENFHARYSAVEREYLYLIYNNFQPSPFFNNRAMYVRQPVDLAYLRDAASYLIGEHDFASFCKKISAEGNTVRRIYSINITPQEGVIAITIKGTAFLHNQIRITIGTLIEMSQSRKNPSAIRDILKAKDRDYSGKTAPACGLYLKNILYEPALSCMPAAF
jgi:tRNA pseudouridine38-40 synthase